MVPGFRAELDCSENNQQSSLNKKYDNSIHNKFDELRALASRSPSHPA
jgi:hypothetical protein